MLLLATSAADQAELINVCGPPGQQAWLCSTVHDITGSASAAQVADDLAKPFRVLVILLVAYLLVRLSRLLIRRVVARLSRDDAGETIDKLRRRTGVAFLDTSPVPNIRRALRAETIGAVLRSIVAALIWATALVMILDTLSVNLAAIGDRRQHHRRRGRVRRAVAGEGLPLRHVHDRRGPVRRRRRDRHRRRVGHRRRREPAHDRACATSRASCGTSRTAGSCASATRASSGPGRCSTSPWPTTPISRRRPRPSAAPPTRWRPTRSFARFVIDDPEVLGVEQVTNDQVVIRLGVKTQPLEQWRVARALRAAGQGRARRRPGSGRSARAWSPTAPKAGAAAGRATPPTVTTRPTAADDRPDDPRRWGRSALVSRPDGTRRDPRHRRGSRSC